MFGWDFEVNAWSRFWRWRFVFELVIWPNRLLWKNELNPRVQLCLWQCFHICSTFPKKMYIHRGEERGTNQGKCITLHQTNYWLSSKAFRFICHYNKKRLETAQQWRAKNGILCVFIHFLSQYTTSSLIMKPLGRNFLSDHKVKFIRLGLHNQHYAKKHATQTTDNTHKFATIISWFFACMKYKFKYCI